MMAFIPRDRQGKNVQEVVLATMVEAGVRPKRTTTKGTCSRELRVKSFHCLLEVGGCYSGQALACAIPVAHIAFVIHECVAQRSDKQHTLALTTCSQHGVVGWVMQ